MRFALVVFGSILFACGGVSLTADARPQCKGIVVTTGPDEYAPFDCSVIVEDDAGVTTWCCNP